MPFCDGKCPYCDFYSLSGNEELKDRYVQRALQAMEEQPAAGPWHTLYFGGGTPSLLGGERIAALVAQAERLYFPQGISQAEVTLEANPTHVTPAFFRAIRQAGVNRLSMGMQSANREELRLLGRKHSREDVRQAVQAARQAGFTNISVDLMLGLPGSNPETLKTSIDFAASLEVEHLSTYLLKVEEGTPFAKMALQLPGDDQAAEQYLFTVEQLEKLGYHQYEISNFAKPGKKSRHNLVYWRGGEYLGFGPGAHGFLEGKRYAYERSLEEYLQGKPPCFEGAGGSPEEFVMLRLRLTEGLTRQCCIWRFPEKGEALFEEVRKKAVRCPKNLVQYTEDRVWFTPEGFLVSNALLLRLLPEDDT